MHCQAYACAFEPLQDALASAGDAVWREAEQRRSNAYFEGREAVLQRFKPGVETVHLVRTLLGIAMSGVSYQQGCQHSDLTTWSTSEGIVTCRCQVFSSRTGDAVYEFPWFSRFKAALEGVVDQVTGQSVF